MGSLHATAYCFADTQRFANYAKALTAVVASDLRIGFFPGMRPPDDFRRHNEQALELTVRRHLFTRARHECESPAADQQTEDLCATLLMVLNGDWRLPVLQHYCYLPGCCNGCNIQVRH